jgi:hypothetical protein
MEQEHMASERKAAEETKRRVAEYRKALIHYLANNVDRDYVELDPEWRRLVESEYKQLLQAGRDSRGEIECALHKAIATFPGRAQIIAIESQGGAAEHCLRHPEKRPPLWLVL